MRRGCAVALVVLVACAATSSPGDDRLRTAKALFFDGEYREARVLWRSLLAETGGAEADTAAYWTARCSEKLGEHERALSEYGTFLDRRPIDQALVEEARTSRVGLAARLYRDGRRAHLPVLTDALKDPSKTVRYYAALQVGGLGRDVGRSAIPVLKRILADEDDPDLVDRAKLVLLRLEPGALADTRSQSEPSERRREVHWLKVRIYKKGDSKPEVSINVPVALAEMLVKSLPEDVTRELRREGYDSQGLLEKLRGLGPAEIVSIEGGDGERIQIWLE